MSNLKPCPFCGSEAEHYDGDPLVNCSNIHCQIWTDVSWTIKEWNTRPIEDKLQAELQQARQMVDSEIAIRTAEYKSELKELQDDLEEYKALNSTQTVSLRKQAEKIVCLKSKLDGSERIEIILRQQRDKAYIDLKGQDETIKRLKEWISNQDCPKCHGMYQDQLDQGTGKVQPCQWCESQWKILKGKPE